MAIGRLYISLSIVIASLFFAHTVCATPVPISTGYQLVGLGYFSGTLDYVATSSTNSSLTLVINNSPSTAAGGFITAVALNLPSISGVDYSGLTTSSPVGFAPLGSFANNDGVNSSPLGRFDFGASLAANGMGSANWQGSGGNPNGGISSNSSGTFVFNFTGNNLNTLSTLSFINAVAPGNSSGPSEFMAVRFKGFVNGGDDKVGGFISSNPPPVPVPASIWLMLSGTFSLGLLARKQTAKK